MLFCSVLASSAELSDSELVLRAGCRARTEDLYCALVNSVVGCSWVARNMAFEEDLGRCSGIGVSEKVPEDDFVRS